MPWQTRYDVGGKQWAQFVPYISIPISISQFPARRPKKNPKLDNGNLPENGRSHTFPCAWIISATESIGLSFFSIFCRLQTWKRIFFSILDWISVANSCAPCAYSTDCLSFHQQWRAVRCVLLCYCLVFVFASWTFSFILFVYFFIVGIFFVVSFITVVVVCCILNCLLCLIFSFYLTARLFLHQFFSCSVEVHSFICSWKCAAMRLRTHI